MPANLGNKTPYSEPRLEWKLQVKRESLDADTNSET